MNQPRTVALLLVALISLSPALARDQAPSRILTVPGLAAMPISPDSLEIRFQLETEHDTFTEAQEAAESMNTRLGQLGVAGIDVAVAVDYDLTSTLNVSMRLEVSFDVEPRP